MEVLFNLAWFVVACLAVAGWLWMPASAPDRQARLRQGVALALLVLILLPVISLTDDLQGTAAWAETEGAGRRLLQAHIAPSVTAIVALTMAGLDLEAISSESVGFIEASSEVPRAQRGDWLHAAATRPPPAA